MSFNSDDQKEFAEADVQDGSCRCRLFCDTYGIDIGPELFDMIAGVLALIGDEQQMRDIVGTAVAAKLKREDHLAHWQRARWRFRNTVHALKSICWPLHESLSS